jgi:hypothetical protein
MRIVRFPVNRYCDECRHLFSRPAKLIMHLFKLHHVPQDKYVERVLAVKKKIILDLETGELLTQETCSRSNVIIRAFNPPRFIN